MCGRKEKITGNGLEEGEGKGHKMAHIRRGAR